MKKSKLFKTISFSSLALLMGIAGTMAFAPLGASPSVASASETVDQINTKADGENIKYAPSALGLDPENDPVIYTTESGLEIKFGGYYGKGGVDYESPDGGALSGYPYFTYGVYSGYPVNWIILAKSTTGTFAEKTLNGVETVADYQKLSVWQGKTARSPSYADFFSKTYEITTPAGLAIKNNNLLNDITARKYEYITTKITDSVIASLPTNSGIAASSVFCVSECVFGSSYWSSSDAGGCDTLNSAISNRFSNLGLTTDQLNVMVTRTAPSYSGAHGIATYLTTDALRVAYNIGTRTPATYWTNQGRSTYTAYCFQSNGALYANSESGNSGRDDVSRGVRLACVIKLA